MSSVNVKIKLMENGKKPEYKREGDVCLDCYSRENAVLKHGERKLIPLGFALELPFGYEAVLRPRSGNSLNGVRVEIGTIDTNYRGEVKACVVNKSGNDFVIEIGDRICQLAVREAPIVIFEEVEELSETVRGANGFGSSGK